MNREQEYQALLAALDIVPDELKHVEEKALTRRKALQIRWRLFAAPVIGLAACFTAFVLLVNLSIPFAFACGRIPLVRELAKVVAWSPSLSAAVENEYVQPIGKTQTENGITVTVEYVIVDRKQLNIFYTAEFSAPGCDVTAWYDYDFGNLHGWAGTAGSAPLTSKELNQISLDFVENDVPADLAVTFEFYREESREMSTAPQNVLSEESPEREEPEHLADITFHLTLDPYFTAQGEIIPIEASFTLDGQQFTLTEVELYPTHLRIGLDAGENNSAWLEGLDLYLENENGQQFRKKCSGITATGGSDGNGKSTFWMDSPFFSQGNHLTLYIVQAYWKDKDVPRVRLDLAHHTAENLPEGIRFQNASRRGILGSTDWEVQFVIPKGETIAMGNQLSYGGFWDEAGNHYDIEGSGVSLGFFDAETEERISEESFYTEIFVLKGLSGDVAYLDPAFNRITSFDIPVVISVK